MDEYGMRVCACVFSMQTLEMNDCIVLCITARDWSL